MRAEDYSISSLAWLGDALYELSIRKNLLQSSLAQSGKLHNQAIEFVAARAQAEALQALMPVLTEPELNLVRRARNFHSTSMPKHQSAEDYRLATALEALLGWHELRGECERRAQLIEYSFDHLLAKYERENKLENKAEVSGFKFRQI